MKKNEGEYGLLINALQLSVKSPIAGYLASGSGLLRVQFKISPKGDPGFKFLQKIVKGELKATALVFKIPDDLFLKRLTSFLMLSRLQESNMKTLAKLDPQYRPFVQKIFGGETDGPAPVFSPKEAAAVVFEHVKKQK